MKNRFQITRILGLYLCLVLFGLAAFAQTEDDPKEDEDVVKSDTTEIAFRKKKFVIISDEEGKRVVIKERQNKDDDWDEYDDDYERRKHRRRHRDSDVDFMALDLGITNYYVDGNLASNAAPPEMELKPFRPASHVALHFFPTTVNLIGRGAVNLKSAITIDWTNYNFTNDVTLIEGPEEIVFETASVDFKQNKLITRYVQIPLLLNFNTTPGSDRGVSFSVGVYGGILWKARTKQKWDENGDTKKIKVNGDFHVNPLKYGLMARLDFRWFDLYLNYNLSEVFEEGEGPPTQAFVAGINLINF